MSDQNLEKVKELQEQLRKSVNEAMDQREESITKSVDGLVTEKIEALNTAIQAEIEKSREQASKAAERAELAAKRVHGGGPDDEPRVKAATVEAFRKMVKNADASEADVLEYKSAFNAYIRKGGGADLMQKAMSVDSDPDGGYVVEPDTSGRIVRLVYETSPVRQVANVVTISTDALEGLNDLDEAEASWVGERSSRVETATPELGRYRIQVHEQYAEPRITQKLLDDAMMNVEGWLADKVADKFARSENAAFVNGDGALKPRGFLTYPAGTPSATSWNVIERVDSGANGAFVAAPNQADALMDLTFALKAAYRQGAVFMMNRSTLAAVRKLKTSDGDLLWTPTIQDSGIGLNLLGYPVVEAEDMPDLATDSLSIAFGNFGVGYQIVDRAGIRVLRDPFTSKPFVKFYTTKRVGGDVVNFEAIKLMAFSS
jgi:HK97 family phage major capsid protein